MPTLATCTNSPYMICPFLNCGKIYGDRCRTPKRHKYSCCLKISQIAASCPWNIPAKLAVAPVIDLPLLPAGGSTAGGTLVTIDGFYFITGCTVTFGGTPATGVTFVSASRITALAPAHTAGSVDVVVINPDTQTGTAVNAYIYI